MIGRKAAVGSIIMVSSRLFSRVFDLVTMLVLARLLLPADFGLVAIAMTLVSIVEAVLELPVNQALLSLPNITTPQYDTAFTLSAARGLLLTSVLLVAAWPFSWFYDDSRLTLLVCVLSLGPAARGMVSPRLAGFQKQMSFWRDFVIQLAGKVAGFATGIAVALLSGSYWSIAAGTVVFPLTMTVVSYGLAPYRPRFGLAASRMFSGFIGWMSAAQVVSAFNWQFERLLLGKLEATYLLGIFATASDLANIPIMALFGPLTQPLLVAFTHQRDDRDLLASSYQRACSAILLLGIPLLVGECLVAEPLILLMFGERWHGAVGMLRWLAISLIPGLFALPAVPLMMVFGKTRWVFRRNVTELCVKLPLVLVCGIKFGFTGVILARCVSETVAALFCARVVRNMVGLSVMEQLFIAWRPVTASLAMALPVLAILHAVPQPTQPMAMAIGLGVAVVGGAITYGIVLIGLWEMAGRPPGVESRLLADLGQRLRLARAG